ncbi:glycosyltransferase family 2 protein [Candidatus Pelagibacter ubique]|nr:glycosyltransferase family 2 protein [Candidatus Pelagibacter ubique]
MTIIVTHSRPNFLRKCIKSIISQSLRPSTIYIVNNNQFKDYNKKIYEEYKKTINIEYIDNFNSIHKIRNDIAFKINCDYLAFIDDDDQWESDYILKSFNLIIKKDLDAIYTSMNVHDEKGNKISELNLKNTYQLSELMIYNPGFLTSNLIVKKKVFKDLDGFSFKYGSADKHFFIRILKENYKFYLNPERLVIRTEHKKQFSKDYRDMFREKIKFFSKNKKDMSFKIKFLYFVHTFKLLIKIIIR